MKNPQTSRERSSIMSKVRRKDTGPEMIVRRKLHSLGFRYKLNDKTLPGSPDIVFAKYKAVIFVHGCFWHRHKDCRLASTPKDNADFWKNKFDNNVARDAQNNHHLIELGWKVILIWQCELKKAVLDQTIHKVVKMLVERD